MNEKDKIILVGDVHGSFAGLSNAIRQNLEDAYIIQVGDFGLFNENPGEKHMLNWLNNSLEKKNCFLYACRGNHDDPKRFQDTCPYDFQNILCIKDYTELNLLGKSILLVGGAISIDRSERTEGEDYWTDEIFVYNSDFDYKKYDLVVTHSRPKIIGFKTGSKALQFYIDKDDKLIYDLVVEGEELDKLYERTKPPEWIFGHFHKSVLIEHENTTFRCLDIGEMYQYYSTTQPFS